MTTTTTTVLPREEWSFFCDAFGRRHMHWPAIVEVIGPDVGAQYETESLPLAGVTYDPKDGEGSISIALGEAPDDHVTHAIWAPTRLVHERIEHDWGGLEVLEIESGDGTKTLLRFKSEILPEMLDEFC